MFLGLRLRAAGLWKAFDSFGAVERLQLNKSANWFLVSASLLSHEQDEDGVEERDIMFRSYLLLSLIMWKNGGQEDERNSVKEIPHVKSHEMTEMPLGAVFSLLAMSRKGRSSVSASTLCLGCSLLLW